MMVELEALGYKLVQSTRASMDVEELVAGRAMEVVVMHGGHRCQLVSIASTRDGHNCDLSILL